jgi:hypothetical protein
MKISIIKIGGNVIDYPEKLDEFLSIFAKVPATNYGQGHTRYRDHGLCWIDQ